MSAGNGSRGPAADVQSLYPFLYSNKSNVDDVLEKVRRSTVDKAREIIALRAEVLAKDGERLLDCADRMAERFDAGGRLLAFGNGGSSTDAQDLVSLFLSPAADARPLPAFCLTNDIAVITALCNDIGFDVVFSSLMLHHLDTPSKDEMLAEVRRVLRPDGVLVLADATLHDHDHHGRRKSGSMKEHLRDNYGDAVAKRIAAAGFTLEPTRLRKLRIGGEVGIEVAKVH